MSTWAPARLDRRIALALAAATFVTLLFTERSVGFVRDEGYYFTAAHSSGEWLRDLWRSPGTALSDAGIVARLEYNREHPALMKLAFGASHIVFHDWFGLRDATAYRLPAFAVAGLLSALLYLLALRLAGRRAALVSVAAFWLVPRHFFNAQLACFDMPVTAAWLAVVYTYLRSLEHPRWGLVCAAVLGVAVSVKHNALFLPPLLLLHWLLAARRAKPTALVAMPFVTPLVVYALWPYLWHHPIDRFQWYLNFHTQHVHYPWHYLGEVLREPPFPIAYPFVVTALTVPLTTLALMAAGWLFALHRVRTRAPDWGLWLLLALNALYSMAIIAWPSVPIFGGVKHWLPSMPFLAICAGALLDAAAARAAGPLHLKPALATAALGALALFPGLIATARIHPYGTSAYNELAGGLPGAASLGMQRQFWSNNVTGVLPWLDRHAPQGARVFFHEVNWESYRAYQENGMLRRDIAYAGGPEDADYVAYQYHQEFREHEFHTWREFGSRTPASGLYLDGTPQVVVYARPGFPGAPGQPIP